MSVGQRYFLRGVFYHPQMVGVMGNEIPMRLPEVGSTQDVLFMRPLNDDTSDFSRTLQGDPLWYIPIAPGEFVDTYMPGLERLDEEIARIDHYQRSVQLQTTSDMGVAPILNFGGVRIVEGREITREDYLTANPVAVVHASFAQLRGLDIGDTFTVSVPSEQSFVTHFNAWNRFVGTFIGSPAQSSSAYELELTIVGLFLTGGESPTVQWTWASTYVYIPDSLLRADSTLCRDVSHIGLDPDFVGWYEGMDYIPSFWYNFVLNDAREVDEFKLAYGEILNNLGFVIAFAQTGAENFWASAEPILQAVTLNTIVFSVVLILALALVVFLYLRQRMKDFAVMRALGVPAVKVSIQAIGALFVFGLPAVVIGAVGGWFYALRRAASTVNPLMEEELYAHTAEVFILWLPAFAAVIIVIILFMVILGISHISRRPVLELMQGSAGAAGNAASKILEPFVPDADVNTSSQTDTVSNHAHNVESFESASASKRRGTLRFIFRHIVRSMPKSVLAAVVALSILVALVFFSETIVRTENDID